MKRIAILLLSACLLLQAVPSFPLYAEEPEAAAAEEKPMDESAAIRAPSALLMEASTGTVILEKNANQPLPPASITKIMTLILIFDALDAGKIKLDDKVTTSAYAASMGGSQVFLEEGEVQTVDTMLKCISVASANDACVAMAEHLYGSEEAFVNQMNLRAKELGMTNTSFVNCCGLDTDGHMTTAYDVALMSRELITKYPQVHNYSTIWMENITHQTKKGTSEFGLTNTNRMIKQYPYATGLKTGSTSKAKFCLSATAKKDGIELIAVVMAADDSKMRIADASSLLNYGFAVCTLYTDEKKIELKPIPVKNGIEDEVKGICGEAFSYLSTTGENLTNITRETVQEEELKAPVKKGDTVGSVVYTLDGKEIGRLSILAEKDIPKAKYKDYVKKAFDALLL